MSLSSKELDVLLHLELQKSAKIQADMERELDEVINVVATYEMLKAKGGGNTSFSQYMKSQEPLALKSESLNQTLDRREVMSRRHDQTQITTMVTPSLSSMSSLLNRLKSIDIEENS